ncbi:MAG: NAD(P)-dependent oxidoreductase [Myxococcales bacterium]|nr:NAD(P)-dependent oxidoreductase [Myxococcales bacterium]
MKVLVTGATGFIGGRLVRHLVREGLDVRGMVRRRPTDLLLDVDWVRGDITDPASLASAAHGVDLVIHTAALLKAPWRKTFLSDNLRGARHIAAACAQQTTPPTLVVVSSMAAHGPSQDGVPRRESDAELPISRYGQMKLACDRALAEWSGRVPLSLVRPPMVFGAPDPTTLKLFRSVERGIHLVPGSEPRRISAIHVDDLARFLQAVGERGARLSSGAELSHEGVYFVAHDDQPTYAQFGRMIAAALGRPRVRVVTIGKGLFGRLSRLAEALGRWRDRPTPLNADKFAEATVGSWHCDTTRASALWDTPLRTLESRLADTVDAYRALSLLARH